MVNVWESKGARESQSPFVVKYHFWILAGLILLAIGVAAAPNPEGLTISGQRVLAIFVLCAGLWVTGVLPLQITSILSLILLPMLNVMSSQEAFALFGNNAVFFILGAFILSAVLVDCGLSTRVMCNVLKRCSFSPRGLRNGIFLFGAAASFWMSEHAVAAMLFPLVSQIVKTFGLTPQKSRFGMSFFLALAWGCVIGGIATYLGGARNPLAAGILFAETGVQIGFVQWMLASLPLVIGMMVVALVILHVRYPEEAIDLDASDAVFTRELESLGPISNREKGVAGLTVFTVVGWVLLHDMFGLATIALLAVVLMFVFRLTQWSVIERNVNWGIILMYGGAIALGSALHSTGAVGLAGGPDVGESLCIAVCNTFDPGGSVVDSDGSHQQCGCGLGADAGGDRPCKLPRAFS